MSFKNKLTRLGCAALVFQFSAIKAAETRIWTSSKGTTIEAKFKKLDSSKGEVYLVTSKSKTIPIKVRDLSLGDRHHLVEYAEADRKILTDVPLTVPEKNVRIDKSKFKSHEKPMEFDDETLVEFDVLESEHFLIASAGRFRPQPLAEMAERLWFGMAFQHQEFRKDWGDKKMVVIVTNDDAVYEAIGQWYKNWLGKNIPDEEKAEEAQKRSESTWMKAAGGGVPMPEIQQEKYNTFPNARIFRLQNNDSSGFKKVFGPFATHGLAKMLITHQMGGVSQISPDGYFAITTGHSYFKEIQLAKKSQTSLLNAGEYGDEDEVASASGFADGRSWAKTLRKLVKRGKIVPKIEELLALDVQTLNPEKLVLMYSFAYYMQSDSARLTAYANMSKRIASNSQIPAPIEMAKIFGFKTVEEMEADWTAFVKSTKFK